MVNLKFVKIFNAAFERKKKKKFAYNIVISPKITFFFNHLFLSTNF